jgi:hypothetical protein
MCLSEAPIAARNFGFDLCEPCGAGLLEERLDAWGATVEIDEVLLAEAGVKVATALLQGGFSPDALEAEYAIEVVAEARGIQPLLASFSRRTFGSTLLGLFAKRVKTGDPLFDARIRCTTATPALVCDLVENDGFQSAVMTLAGHCGTFKVESRKIHVVVPLTDLDLRAEIPLAACSVLRHVALRS